MNKVALSTIVLFLVTTRFCAAQEARGDRGTGERESFAREIWLGPQSLPPPPLAQDADFMDLFHPDAPWEVAASHTRVFKLYGSFLGHASQEQVNAVVSDLNRRGIAIAVEIGTINVNFTPPPPCGGLGIVEGYGTPALATRISQMIKSAGGQIRYISMDEPLFFGHYFSGAHACHSSIDEVVQLIVPTLSAFEQEFPGIVIGDIEPTNLLQQPDWQNSWRLWTDGFLAATHRPLAFVQLDVPWDAPNPHGPAANAADGATLFHFLEQLRRAGLVEKLGIIYNGAASDTTDQAWVFDAQNHVRQMEMQFALSPDQAILQSWQPHPTHALPETSPNTLTHLVNFYFDFQHERERNQK